jgi:hypothetical protein
MTALASRIGKQCQKIVSINNVGKHHLKTLLDNHAGKWHQEVASIQGALENIIKKQCQKNGLGIWFQKSG